MKSRIFILVLTIFASTGTIAYEERNELTELQKARAENWKLRAQLAQCTITITQSQLKSEQEQLINEYRKQLNAKETDKFDWSSLSFISGK